jgi:hypothetical protein
VIDADGAVRKTVSRQLLRAQFASLFWSIIQDRKKTRPGGYSLQMLADVLGIHKSAVSRWFNALPNWRTDTIADIAKALGVDIQLVAIDRVTGQRYTPLGPETVTTRATAQNLRFLGNEGIKTLSSGRFDPAPDVITTFGATGS